jgi:hypothetical protein
MRRYIVGFALASLFVVLQAAPAAAAIKMIEFKSGTNVYDWPVIATQRHSDAESRVDRKEFLR